MFRLESVGVLAKLYGQIPNPDMQLIVCESTTHFRYAHVQKHVRGPTDKFNTYIIHRAGMVSRLFQKTKARISEQLLPYATHPTHICTLRNTLIFLTCERLDLGFLLLDVIFAPSCLAMAIAAFRLEIFVAISSLSLDGGMS